MSSDPLQKVREMVEKWRRLEKNFNIAYSRLRDERGIEASNIHVAANNLKLCALELEATLSALDGASTESKPLSDNPIPNNGV